MNISFDLDSTLIPHGGEFETERLSFMVNLFRKIVGIETIRLGTKGLVSELKKRGYTVHIYTTSYRRPLKIRLMLLLYRVRVGRIVNQSQNNRELKVRKINSSKYPPAFGFDYHIDDSKGVEKEGQLFNFKVIQIEPQDKNWTETVRKALKSYK